MSVLDIFNPNYIDNVKSEVQVLKRKKRSLNLDGLRINDKNLQKRCLDKFSNSFSHPRRYTALNDGIPVEQNSWNQFMKLKRLLNLNEMAKLSAGQKFSYRKRNLPHNAQWNDFLKFQKQFGKRSSSSSDRENFRKNYLNMFGYLGMRRKRGDSSDHDENPDFDLDYEDCSHTSHSKRNEFEDHQEGESVLGHSGENTEGNEGEKSHENEATGYYDYDDYDEENSDGPSHQI